MIRPYVVTIHDMANLMFDEERSRPPDAVAALPLPPRTARASRVIAVSEATRRDVENLMGVPPDRIRRVYNAPDPGFLHASAGADAEEQQRIMERYQIKYPFLLYAGNIRRHKNVPRLVEAFAVVREQLASHPVYKDLRLVIIGDTISQYPAVRQAVIKSRVEHVVRFLGFVPFETLRCFYEFAAAFVFPSRYEGFGLPPLEAMACGTPVVTSNVSSLPEVVGDAAVLVNPENVFDIARGIRDVLLDETPARRADPARARAGGALQLGADGAPGAGDLPGGSRQPVVDFPFRPPVFYSEEALTQLQGEIRFAGLGRHSLSWLLRGGFACAGKLRSAGLRLRPGAEGRHHGRIAQQLHSQRHEADDRRSAAYQSRGARNPGDHSRLQQVVRNRLLPVHQHPAGRKLDVGRDAHSSALFGA